MALSLPLPGLVLPGFAANSSMGGSEMSVAEVTRVLPSLGEGLRLADSDREQEHTGTPVRQPGMQARRHADLDLNDTHLGNQESRSRARLGRGLRGGGHWVPPSLLLLLGGAFWVQPWASRE